MLTPQEQFRSNLLCKVASMGLTADQAADVIEQLADAVEKQAENPLSKTWNAGVDVTTSVFGKALDKLAPLGLTAAIAGPFVGGLSAGLGYRKLTDIEDDDVEAARIRELTATYQQLARQAKQKQLLRELGR